FFIKLYNSDDQLVNFETPDPNLLLFTIPCNDIQFKAL
ncbi:MAG: hypothetical protein ACI8P3_001687, partial [Saprospiraceae bacterium]